MKEYEKKKKNILKKAKNKIIKIMKIIGPGFVTGAADDDPSGIGTYSIAGARYGLLLAWLVPFQLPLMFVMQEMCARIGLVTGRGLTANMKRVFSRPFIFLVVLLLAFANIFNISANIAIMAASVRLIFGGNITLLAILLVMIIIFMEFFFSYHTYSKILIWLTLFLFAYIITAFMVPQDWSNIFRHIFSPCIIWDKHFILVMAGFLGTSISPYLFFWQTSQEVEDKLDLDKVETGHSRLSIKKLIKRMRLDTFAGMFFSQIIALFIVITCYSTLHKNGITKISTAYESAMALKPLAGEWAFLIFTIGIIGAGFLGIPVLAGSAAYALSELFGCIGGFSHKLKDALFFYTIIIFSMVIGLLINFIGINPLKALLYAAVINCIVAVPLIAFIIIIANKKEIMGKNRNRFISNFIGWLTFLVMFLVTILVFIFLRN